MHPLLWRYIKYYIWTFGLVMFFWVAFSIPNAQLISPTRSAIVLGQNSEFIGQIGGDKELGYGYWPIADIPPRIMQATLALEDKRFWNHPGVDPAALLRALWQNISQGKRISGASTLTMQIARMQNPGRRTYLKKIQEIMVALLITLRYNREQIIKHYLRLVPYANQSHGIAHAAYIYFEKPIQDLSWAEIAFLSAIPQSPGISNPFTHRGRQRARKRGNHLLKLMYQAKLMDNAEYELSQQQLLVLNLKNRKTRNHHFMHAILYLENQYNVAKDHFPSVIHTYLDSGLQKKVNLLSYNARQRLQAHGAENIAVVVSRRKDNAILVWSGSTDYFDKETAGALDYIRTPRSPGSTLKPFIYALALEKGVIRANSILDDLPSRARGIINADNRFLGPMLPRQALGNSRNIPAINLVQEIGLNEVFGNLFQLGLHQNQQPAKHFGLGIAVGSMPTTLEQLMTAYSSLANDGQLKPLIWLKESKPQTKKIFSKDIARLISLYLSDPMARLPTFSRMGSSEYPFPVAIKTGTSQGYRDAWTIAYSKEYLVGIWIGRPDAQGMKKLSGSASSSYLAQDILLSLNKKQANGYKDLGFAKPLHLQRVNLCSFTGFLASRDCHQQSSEWVSPEYKPTRTSPTQWLKIDKRNGLLASDWTPIDSLEIRKFLDLPMRYSNWAQKKGISMKPYKYSLLDYKPGMSFKDPQVSFNNFKQERRIKLKIASPVNRSRFLLNPHVPQDTNSISLHVDVDGHASEVLWYVDGQPYKLASPPYDVRWLLQTGPHTFQVKLPYRQERSGLVKVWVE